MEAIGKKRGLNMDFFRKGSDPAPLIFRSSGTREAHLSFGHQTGEKHNFPKTTKMAILKIICLRKMPKSCQNPLF